MNTVITYDIVDDKRRARLYNFLKEFGVGSQYSVFECRLELNEIRLIRRWCSDNLDIEEDSLRIYRVCSTCMNKVIVQGQGIKFSNLDWVIV